MSFLLLPLAILAEVVGTISLKLSHGFTRPVPSVVVAVGYILSFVLLAEVLKRGMSVSFAYAVWSAAGTALVATIGVLYFGEPLRALKAIGLVLVIGGVVALHLGETGTSG